MKIKVVDVVNENNDGEHQTTTLDYARLTTILWSVCQNLNERIKVLEAK